MAKVLVTGANRGIGLELCRQLLQRGDSVIGTCRKDSAKLTALDGTGSGSLQIETNVDVTSAAQVEGLAKRLSGEPIDVLINNAGLLTHGDALGQVDFDMALKQFEVNALGPVRITSALRQNLGSGAKVIIITSRMGSIADNTSGGRYGYRMSKAAVNIAGVSLARDLAPQGIAVAILHPGFVRTDMTGGQGLIDADESARGLISRIDDLTLETSGGFWHENGERLPW